MSLCEKNCEYSKYDYNTKKVLCQCLTKNEITSEKEINKNKLLNNFKDIKNILNIKVIKCYKEVFNKEGLINNIGFYIMSTIILFIFVLSSLFKIKGYNNLNNEINEIIKKNNPPIKKQRKASFNRMMTNKDINSKIEMIRNAIFNIKITNEEVNSKIEKISKIQMVQNKNNYLNNEQDINNTLNKKINYNDYEFNNLSYKQALKLDKRTYFQYYFSLLKMKHIILFTFYTNNDYNSKIIKIILFLFTFALYFTINLLFFNEATLHKIYEDQGKYNFVYQIPYIFYSTIITSVLNIILKYLSLTENTIIELKKIKNNIKEQNSKIIEYLTKKLIIFFILIFTFLLFFWYYLICFCGIYKKTQIHLIKDTLISFGLSLIYPFLLYLLPGIFRISSLNKNNECMFKTSKIIQLI